MNVYILPLALVLSLLSMACSPGDDRDPEPAVGRTQGDGKDDGTPDTARDFSHPIRNLSSDTTATP